MEVWGITPDTWSPARTREEVNRVLSLGVRRVILRERRLSLSAQLALGQALLEDGVSPHRVLLRTETPPPQWHGGVHLPTGARSPGPHLFCSAVAHDAHEMAERHRNPPLPDAVLVSPWAVPRSKESTAAALGPQGLAALVAQSHIPVIALGGITPEAVGACRRAGAVGVAAITAVFGDERELQALLDACAAEGTSAAAQAANISTKQINHNKW